MKRLPFGAQLAAIVLALLLFALASVSGLLLASLNAPAIAAFDFFELRAPHSSTQIIQILGIAPRQSATGPVAATAPPPTTAYLAPPTPLPRLLQQTSVPPSGVADGAPFIIGQSVQGRIISGVEYSSGSALTQALVLAGGIHGDEVNAVPALHRLEADLQTGLITLPPSFTLYILPVLNPDGASRNHRMNANGVDLNRNWDTYDWQPHTETSVDLFIEYGGGREAFSEPETLALSRWLLATRDRHSAVTIIYFHAAFPPDGLVTPGNHRTGAGELADTHSRLIGEHLAKLLGYQYDNRWVGGYEVTGDATTWAVANDIRALTVELPVSGALTAQQSDALYSALVSFIGWMGR